MNRPLLNQLVDLIAAALFLGMIATGYLLEFTLPPGTNRAYTLWGLTRHCWGTVHGWISFGFLGAMLLHVCLHWPWVVAVVRKRLGKSAAPPSGLLRSGLATLLIVAAALGLFAWVAQTGVRPINDPEEFGVCPPDAAGEPAPAPAAARPDERPAVAFWAEVYPVLEQSCVPCHGPQRQAGGFRADRRADYFGTAGRAALVLPGNSAASPLIAIVSGQRPDIPKPGAHRLPKPVVARLRAWIDAGADWPERQ
jgi:hypothetical protein